jgi:hypothetical protein
MDILNHALALFGRHVVELGAVAPVCFRRLAGHVRLSDKLVRTEPRGVNCSDPNTALEMEYVAPLNMAQAPHLIEHLIRNRSCWRRETFAAARQIHRRRSARQNHGANRVAQLPSWFEQRSPQGVKLSLM